MIFNSIEEAQKVFDEEVGECDHECTGDCRRHGCNCSCGEYHEEDKSKRLTNWLEDNLSTIK